MSSVCLMILMLSHESQFCWFRNASFSIFVFLFMVFVLSAYHCLLYEDELILKVKQRSIYALKIHLSIKLSLYLEFYLSLYVYIHIHFLISELLNNENGYRVLPKSGFWFALQTSNAQDHSPLINFLYWLFSVMC